MRASVDNLPVLGPEARCLGVRPGIDIPVAGGLVSRGTGGLSVAPHSAMSLPSHRRPNSLGGTGKDPVWALGLDGLPSTLNFQQDSANHGLIEPAFPMTLRQYEEALAQTRRSWRRHA
jgi:hypothetical protein